MSTLQKIDDASDPDEQSDLFFSTKKDKESKRQKLKRIITRPLRRSQSACCENEIPSHALFLDTKNGKSKDTMENRALDLFLYQRLFGSHDDDDKARRFHKTCSAESALAENVQAKSKSMDHESSFPFFNTTTHDQALQWSKSLDDLLRDKNGVELFLLFLRSEFSEENLEFWIACEEFRTCNESSMPIMAQKIYNEFVVSKAPKEVNLDADTKTETIENLESLSRDTFDAPQHKIQALMAKDSYPRFLESDLYQFLIENVSKV
ncbi:regulator of G-protein signaling 4-like [Mytilus californianus]|uniref:regulator of G-protein signaling 4-like n=1 Tax=Mytilus californianus TaxID=6549 RepID=UPI0022479F0C|nr:regulator of G-protein signaling 4-like [Mytilus californianus]